MSFELSKEEFLKVANISEQIFISAKIEWHVLEAIASDYKASYQALESVAEQVSSRIRTFEGVHSVRWRIKDTLHLLKKIIRKRAEPDPKDKWMNIDSSNYLSIVTDLIGVRALHLFRDECLGIDDAIRKTWNLAEPVLIFKRDGDRIQPEMVANGGQETVHEAGYRSIHYIAQTQPEKTEFLVEIQVRTIFQEGWSEIDHRVKYPDYSDNPQLAIFLGVFNGLAGSADEMGSFVQELTKILHASEQANLGRELAVAERDKTLLDMNEKMREHEELLKEQPKGKATIQQLEKQNKKYQAVIEGLKADLEKLNSSASKQGDFAGGIDINRFVSGDVFREVDLSKITSISNMFSKGIPSLPPVVTNLGSTKVYLPVKNFLHGLEMPKDSEGNDDE
ncbi:RelA/SpoT domain-containing protein [Pseudomonas sp. EA_15y_Pfl1_P104]|uniref:RelA/SpoT domain-containing protein n=1 Tax=Pseudomonas sp. EA_15y_Pfl1_P104 TaxID=3088686 RepID=UPI0030DD9C47